MSALHPLHASQITNARRQGATQEILIKVPSYIRLEYKVRERVNERTTSNAKAKAKAKGMGCAAYRLEM